MRLSFAFGAAVAAVTAFAGAPVRAADLPYEAPAMAVAVDGFTWSGVYVGGAIGYAFSDLKVKDRDFSDFRYKDSVDSILGTAYVGVNYQFDAFVIGAEADISLGDFGGKSKGCGGAGAFALTCKANAGDVFGTVRGRIGYAFDRFLVFGTGGLAIGESVDLKRDFPAAPAFGFRKDDSGTRYGYAIGAGVEYAVTDNIIVRGEYQYVDFGKEKLNLESRSIAGASQRASIDQDMHVIRAGVAYKF